MNIVVSSNTLLPYVLYDIIVWKRNLKCLINIVVSSKNYCIMSFTTKILVKYLYSTTLCSQIIWIQYVLYDVIFTNNFKVVVESHDNGSYLN